VIRLGVRLALGGGREAWGRLALVAAGVALGVSMLLGALAGINAVNAQNARYGWLDTHTGGGASVAGMDPLWWRVSSDEFAGRVIGRVDEAATGARSPVPPGIPRLPGPGQYYASPAMAALLRSTPAAELGARYPGRLAGLIGPAALPAPDSLIVIIGRRADELAHAQGAERVTAIGTAPPSACSGDCYDIGINANGIELILSVVTAALLFPIMTFIGTATRLSAARREQRFAAMRLAGATPGQISLLAAVESGLAALAGVAAGFGLFYLGRPALARIDFTGGRFFTADLSLSAADVLLVAAGVPVAAVAAAWLALRRVGASPLAVARRVTPPAPRAWRVLPLLIGLGELAWFVHAGRPRATSGQAQAYMFGILMTMVGLVVVGPWLTGAVARPLARRTGRPAVLLAARRLADNPSSGFRAIGGLVLALFVTSVAVATITTIDAYGVGGRDRPLVRRGPAERATLIDRYQTYTPAGPRDAPAIPAGLPAELRSVPGVLGVTVVHTISPDSPDHPAIGAVTCAQLADTPALGQCPAGATTVNVGGGADWSRGGINEQRWPPAGVPVTQLERLPVQAVVVAANGPAAVERARSALRLANPDHVIPLTIAEEADRDRKLNRAYQRLANLVMLISLPVAGCGLAVGAIAGLAERGRPFSLLRLAGTPLGLLRRVVALENAVPLLAGAVVAIATGFLTAGLFLRSQLGETVRAPAASYYALVGAGLVASLLVIASTLPLLERATGPAIARND